MVIEIQDTTGKEKSYNLPDSIDQVGYADFVRFAENANDVTEFFVDHVKEETLESNMPVHLYKIATAISTLIGDDLNAVLRLPRGDRTDHINNMVDYCTFVTNQKGSYPEQINVGQVKSTLYSIYKYLLQALMSYKPSLETMQEEFRFEYNGKEYYVPGFLKDAITNQDIAPSLETGRAIEIYQIDKEYQDQLRELKAEMKKEDADKSTRTNKQAVLKYNKTIRMLALFVRRKGMAFPVDPEKVKSYVTKMSVELQGIPARVGLDIVFFLNHTTALLEIIRCMRMLSNPQGEQTLSRRSY